MIASRVLLALNDHDTAININAHTDLISWRFVTATYDGDDFLDIAFANPSAFPLRTIRRGKTYHNGSNGTRPTPRIQFRA